MKDKKSNTPFNYNAALVEAVSGAYGGGDMVTPQAIQGLAGGLYSGIKTIADRSRSYKDKLLKQNVSTDTNTSQFTEKEVNNLIALKDEYSRVTDQLSKPFVSREKKQQLNAELNRINNSTANYIKSVNHMMDLQEGGIENDEMRKGIYTKQENMLWDQIVTGNARDMAADNFDINTGKTYFANPHGTPDNPLNVLSWKPMKTMNGKWIQQDTKVFDSIRKYAKDDDTPREVVLDQVGSVISANYYSDPEAIFDSAGIDKFVDSLYGSEFDNVLAERFPSDYDEMQQTQAKDPNLARSQYKQLMRQVDLSDQWIDFRTNEAMNQFDLIKNQASQAQNERLKGRTSKPLDDVQVDKAEAFIKNIEDNVSLFPLPNSNNYIKKIGDNKYMLSNSKGVVFDSSVSYTKDQLPSVAQLDKKYSVGEVKKPKISDEARELKVDDFEEFIRTQYEG